MIHYQRPQRGVCVSMATVDNTSLDPTVAHGRPGLPGVVQGPGLSWLCQLDRGANDFNLKAVDNLVFISPIFWYFHFKRSELPHCLRQSEISEDTKGISDDANGSHGTCSATTYCQCIELIAECLLPRFSNAKFISPNLSGFFHLIHTHNFSYTLSTNLFCK